MQKASGKSIAFDKAKKAWQDANTLRTGESGTEKTNSRSEDLTRALEWCEIRDTGRTARKAVGEKASGN